ncbi:MAG: YlxR family protein [Clostridia bacterium]|nr:YlxR family protein [Clostridia bacterium]
MEKKIPLRKCLGCNEMKPKKELMRIVKTKEGEVFIDETGKANGRGTYVCSLECAKKVATKKMLDRAFGEKIEQNLYDELLNSILEKESENK